MYNIIKWMTLAFLLLSAGFLFSDTKANTGQQDVGAMYVSVTCKTDGTGVTYCFDSKTGKGWYIRPSITGTRVG